MNERIKQLAEHAGIYKLDLSDETEYWIMENFAELIVRECILTIQLKIIRNGNTPENIRSGQHVTAIAEKFGIELPMNYFGITE